MDGAKKPAGTGTGSRLRGGVTTGRVEEVAYGGRVPYEV